MNYYDVLRVDKKASQQEIRDSYKKLIKRYHPDLYPGNKTKAESITRDLNEAYETLSDPDKRQLYDYSLEPHTEDYISPEPEPEPVIYYQAEPKLKPDEKPNFQEKLRENIHDFVDKHSENLSAESKKAIIIIIIFFALLILLLSAKDFLDFQFSMQEKRIEKELNSQNIVENAEVFYNQNI